MENYIRSLRNFVAANPPDFGDSDADSVLDMLYAHYNEFNGFDKAPIKDGFENLYARIEELRLCDKDRIIDIVCSLCREHEKAGFAEGVKVGIRLEQELA